jgi:hypothetical protein
MMKNLARERRHHICCLEIYASGAILVMLAESTITEVFAEWGRGKI